MKTMWLGLIFLFAFGLRLQAAVPIAEPAWNYSDLTEGYFGSHGTAVPAYRAAGPAVIDHWVALLDKESDPMHIERIIVVLGLEWHKRGAQFPPAIREKAMAAILQYLPKLANNEISRASAISVVVDFSTDKVYEKRLYECILSLPAPPGVFGNIKLGYLQKFAANYAADGGTPPSFPAPPTLNPDKATKPPPVALTPPPSSGSLAPSESSHALKWLLAASALAVLALGLGYLLRPRRK